MVFWRDRGWKEEDDAVEARGVWSITDIITVATQDEENRL